MHLKPDPLVDELRRLAPEISVGGGSFAHWLPPPAEVSPGRRVELLERTRRNATGRCLTDLLESAGLPTLEPGRLASGERDWPAGYVGSVSHKGAKVAAALAPAGVVGSLGIDIETQDGAEDLSGISGLTTADAMLPASDVVGPTINFSVKEAIFKALYPILGRRLGFEDVTVLWMDVRPSGMSGTGRYRDVALDIRCSTAISPWVASVALVSPRLRHQPCVRLDV